MRNFLIWLIRRYQKYLSFDTGIPHKLMPWLRMCRFTPTCSQYTIDALQKYGTVKGFALGFYRILRCNPFSKGGEDKLQ